MNRGPNHPLKIEFAMNHSYEPMNFWRGKHERSKCQAELMINPFCRIFFERPL